MILELIIFAVLCFILIAKLLNDKWKLKGDYNNNINFINLLLNDFRRQKEEHVSEVDDLQSRLALAGKNYIIKTNELMNEIELNKKTIKTLKSKIKDLKKKNK